MSLPPLFTHYHRPLPPMDFSNAKMVPAASMKTPRSYGRMKPTPCTQCKNRKRFTGRATFMGRPFPIDWVCSKSNYVGPDVLDTSFDCPCFEQRDPTWQERLAAWWKRARGKGTDATS